VSNDVLRALTEFEPEGTRNGELRPGASSRAVVCVDLSLCCARHPKLWNFKYNEEIPHS